MMNSVADRITPELPYLRRFARAMTGSQESGDAYVAAMLEAVIADPGQFREEAGARVATYGAFLRIWEAMPLNNEAEASVTGPGDIADKRLGVLTPRSRQAFLLAAVEELTIEEIAQVMSTDTEQVKRYINQAGKEISDQIAARALIIEDEPLIALDIEELVSEIGHEVVGIARTRVEAGQLAQETSPSLVLADIQLADGSSGIDAVNDILGNRSVPVIFITAYPERLLTGRRAEPTFLITKPFKAEMVKAVISQALFFDVKAGTPT
jgi:DNA-directed RNA polymerase specialized sigma24 family protein